MLSASVHIVGNLPGYADYVARTPRLLTEAWQTFRRRTIVDIETFQSLPMEEVARLVREAGPKVCVFPISRTTVAHGG